MKKIILSVCTVFVILGLCGCAAADGQENSANATTMELVSFGTTITVPLDTKEGTLLEDGSCYFTDVDIQSMQEAKDFIEQYHTEGESDRVYFATPDYWGCVAYIAENNAYAIMRSGDTFEEERTYNEEGLVSSGYWEKSSAPPQPEEPIVLSHGVKIDDRSVYIDTGILNIEGEKDIAVFLGLFEEYFRGCDSEYAYSFVTDIDEYVLRRNGEGSSLAIRPIDISGTFTEITYKYNLDNQQTGYREDFWKDGDCYKFIVEEDGRYFEREDYDDGSYMQKEIKNGVTKVEKVHRADGGSYYDYFRKDDTNYANNSREIFLTYDESGTRLIGYKAIHLLSGEVYDWVLDGNGLEAENFVSVTITANGTSTTYVGKEQIPWGAAIYYPPRIPGLYE